MAVRPIAFAFDFDGVLVGLDAHNGARIQAFEEFAESTGDERFLAPDQIHSEAHLYGSHPPQIIGWILQKQGLVSAYADPAKEPLTLAVVERKNELYISKVEEGLEALPDSLECLDWASERFTPKHLAIATTASVREVRPFIKRYGLEDKIGTIVTREDTPPEQLKPDPFVYNLAAVKMDVSPQTCVALEDSVRGLQAAKFAGFTALGITTTHSRAQLSEVSDYTVESFEEVPVLIDALGQPN